MILGVVRTTQAIPLTVFYKPLVAEEQMPGSQRAFAMNNVHSQSTRGK